MASSNMAGAGGVSSQLQWILFTSCEIKVLHYTSIFGKCIKLLFCINLNNSMGN